MTKQELLIERILILFEITNRQSLNEDIIATTLGERSSDVAEVVDILVETGLVYREFPRLMYFDSSTAGTSNYLNIKEWETIV